MQRTLAHLLVSVRSADDWSVLRRLRDDAQELLLRRPFPVSPLDWNESVNRLHDETIRRSLALVERRMTQDGFGPPPVPYSFVLFGSGGRREQTLWSDQDNGIVYAAMEGDAGRAHRDYFSAFGRTIVAGLKLAGYPPCEGNVICSDGLWCRPLGEWEGAVNEWIANPTWENIRHLLIVADMRHLAGYEGTAAAVRGAMRVGIERHPAVLADMLRNTLYRKVSLSPIGRLIPERFGDYAGGIDVKYGAYIPLVNAIRLLAVACGVGETSTPGRIDALVETGIIRAELGQRWQHAFSVTVKLRALTAQTTENGVFSTRGIIRPGALTKEVRRELKLILKHGRRLQTFVRRHIETAAGQRDKPTADRGRCGNERC